MKIGRNSPCPCGSGKKYKNCHLDPNTETRVAVPSVPAAPKYPSIDIETTPDPLNRGYLKQDVYTITYGYTSPLPGIGPDPRPEGYPGVYTVEFTLQPPSRVVLHDENYSADPDLPGGSLLAIAKPSPRDERDVARISVDVTSVQKSAVEPIAVLRYEFLPNAEGFLSTIKVRLRAEGAADAEEMALKNLLPLLSEWSFVHDVPLDIARIRTEEEATRTCRCLYTRQAYQKVALETARYHGFGQLAEQYHPLVFYREALSAVSPLYQFLCYYKVLELVKSIRRRKADAAKKAGSKAPVFTERLVENAWLKKNVNTDLLTQVVGKTFPDIQLNVLRPVRVRVAHAFLEDEDPTTRAAEELLNTTEVYKMLPLVKYMARSMVSHDMNIPV
jgi:hypothetical protein